ncbi:BDF1 [Enterospora canceri]|uniref:BDF1 n=1 Tax=Enterospora canceri TaxID=1081671 RepID=A0A1Y1S8J9_9MICR|nr:BDF1 [Enterospora canceri]
MSVENSENITEEKYNPKILNNIMRKMRANANAGPFLQPVDPVALGIPDYAEKIKEPMDLGTIKKKLADNSYTSNEQFKTDMNLIFNNCYLYNGKSSPVGQMGVELEKAFINAYEAIENTKEEVEQNKKPTLKNKIKAVKMSQSDFELANGVLNELEKAKYKKTTWAFTQPVTDAEAPGYSAIIKNPMDMSRIRSKLTSREYENLQGFKNDLILIVENCKLYNPENSEIFRLGVEFEKLFKRELSKKELGPDAEIEELRKKISDLMMKLNSLEEAKRLENDLIFGIEIRESLGNKILAVGREESDKIVEIIQRSCSSFSYVGNDEIEVNMLTLPDHVVGEIKEFMDRLENKTVESNESCD